MLALRALSILRGFNRTFMELKFRKIRKVVRSRCVLIVPLWN